MADEKFERQDVVNGLALAAMLLFLLLLILLAVWSCTNSLKGVAESEKKVVETTAPASDALTVPEEPKEVIPAKDPVSYTHLTLPTTPYV